MAYIRADHVKMAAAAGRIDSYCSRHKTAMRNMRTSVESLGSSWNGEDYAQVVKEWREIEAAGSTSDKMLRSVQNHADSIRAAAAKYKEAQARAYNRANQLCK